MAERFKVTAVTGEVRYFNDEFDARVWAGLNGRIELIAQEQPTEPATGVLGGQIGAPVVAATLEPLKALGTQFRITSDGILRFADDSCRPATEPEKAMWKRLHPDGVQEVDRG